MSSSTEILVTRLLDYLGLFIDNSLSNIRNLADRQFDVALRGYVSVNTIDRFDREYP